MTEARSAIADQVDRISDPTRVAVGARVDLVGIISAAGFDDDHRFVIGYWPATPFGPFADVMWATPGGERILLASSAEAAEFITSIYSFDDVRVGPLMVESDGRSTSAVGHGLDIELVGGRRRRLPGRRPLWVTSLIEAPIARRLMGVETHGTSPTGVREWYQARSWCWVRDGCARLLGRDLGSPRPFERPIGVGFSEPPERPSIVAVRVTIDLAALHQDSGEQGTRGIT